MLLNENKSVDRKAEQYSVIEELKSSITRQTSTIIHRSNRIVKLALRKTSIIGKKQRQGEIIAKKTKFMFELIIVQLLP